MNRLRAWYARLLRLYPQPFRDRFAASMEQTFHDVLRDRAARGRGVFACALGMFVETAGGIMNENLASARKPLLVVAAETAALLLVPLVAMRFTDEVKWDPEDFVFAGLLLFGAGSAFVLVSRRLTGFTYKAAAGLAVGASLFLVWANAAVGLMGSENHPANLMYGAVLGVGFLGAAIARLEPRGLARTMLAMALVQVLVPVLAGVAWNSPGIPEAKVIGVTGFFVTLFVISALLFRHAAGPKFKNQGIP